MVKTKTSGRYQMANSYIVPLGTTKAWFKRRILHAPNQILILVDSN